MDQEYKSPRKTARGVHGSCGVSLDLQKIFLHAAHSKYLNLYIDQKTDKEIRFVYRFKFFGGSDLIEVRRGTYKNLWNETVKSLFTWTKSLRPYMTRVLSIRNDFPRVKGMGEWKMGLPGDVIYENI